MIQIAWPTLLLFATAYQRHPYRFPVIGEIEIYNQLTQEQVMQYYKTRYVPNNLTFVVVGDVDAQKVRQQLTELFKPYPEKSLQPVFIPAEPPQLGRREVHQEFATELTHLSLAWHIPEVTNPDVPALDLALDHPRRWSQLAPVPARARRGRSGVQHIRIFLHARRSRFVWHRCYCRSKET